MIQIQVGELPKEILPLLQKVEKGEHYRILQNNQPIAEILPIRSTKQGWKRKIEKISLIKNVKPAQDALQEERELE